MFTFLLSTFSFKTLAFYKRLLCVSRPHILVSSVFHGPVSVYPVFHSFTSNVNFQFLREFSCDKNNFLFLAFQCLSYTAPGLEFFDFHINRLLLLLVVVVGDGGDGVVLLFLVS